MKWLIYVFLLLHCSISAQEDIYQRIENYNLPNFEIKCSIVLEDIPTNYYAISWQVPYLDSLRSISNQTPTVEMHCFVADSTGIIGFYKGLSTPMQHCFFQTKDSTVTVYFRWRSVPYYSTQTYGEEEIISIIQPNYIRPMGSEFNAIQLNIHRTINTPLILTEDTNAVILSYGTPSKIDPLGYPTIMGLEFGSKAWILDRYYLNLKNGRIKTGKEWLTIYDIEDIVSKDRWVLVHPDGEYPDLEERTYSGKELISKKKIKIKSFTSEVFLNNPHRFFPY